MRALPGTPVGGLFPPRLPPAIGEGQPHMAEHFRAKPAAKIVQQWTIIYNLMDFFLGSETARRQ